MKNKTIFILKIIINIELIFLFSIFMEITDNYYNVYTRMALMFYVVTILILFRRRAHD